MRHTTELQLPETIWNPIGETDPFSRLLATITVTGQCNLHLEARQIDTDDEGIQEMRDYPDDMGALWELAQPDNGFETYTAFGRTYILFATPYGN